MVAGARQNGIIILDHISSNLDVGDANQLERFVFSGTPLADGDYFRGMWVIDPDWDHSVRRPGLGQRSEPGVSDRAGICGIKCPGCFAPIIADHGFGRGQHPDLFFWITAINTIAGGIDCKGFPEC